MNTEKIIQKLVDIFIETHQLGHYGDYYLCLYDIRNNKDEINNIIKLIETVTKKYKLIILDKEEPITNINILDINL